MMAAKFDTPILGKAFRFFLIALLLVPWLHVVPAYSTPRQTTPTFGSGLFVHDLPVFSDFDGDDKLDQAALSSDGRLKEIHVTLGTSSWSSLTFDSGVPERGRLVSGDIDGDGDVDLVWVAASDTTRHVTWFADGRGHFSTGREPEFRRIEPLLGNSESLLADNSDSQELACVPLSASLVAPQNLVHDHHVSLAETWLAAAQPRVISPSCLSVLRKRGPPSVC
jgi:hypothetical protein